jgi:ATP-dependent RNA helicase DeaD
LKLENLKFFVLDEADELLSLGFWPDMREIEKYLPPKEARQTCLFSATMPEKVRALTRIFQRDPEFVTLSEGQIGPAEIEHYFYLVTAQEKEHALVRVLEYEDPESAIIFCNTKDDVRYVTGFLQRRGFDADQISGDLQQSARERAMARIKAGEMRFLVATDVAARGIDISDLTCVIGYATPDQPEVYVHRTGRTGRAGKAGLALSLVSALDIGNFRYLQNVNRITIPERRLPTEADLQERLRERLAVKVEQEMRSVPAPDRSWKIDRFVPVVQSMAENDEGRRELAAICAAYMREPPADDRLRSGSRRSSTAARDLVVRTQRRQRRRRQGGGGSGGSRRGGRRWRSDRRDSRTLPDDAGRPRSAACRQLPGRGEARAAAAAFDCERPRAGSTRRQAAPGRAVRRGMALAVDLERGAGTRGVAEDQRRAAATGRCSHHSSAFGAVETLDARSSSSRPGATQRRRERARPVARRCLRDRGRSRPRAQRPVRVARS